MRARFLEDPVKGIPLEQLANPLINLSAQDLAAECRRLARAAARSRAAHA
jgi:hypothetical protein